MFLLRRKGCRKEMYDLGEDIAWRVGLYFVDPINADLMLSTDFYDDDDEVIPGFKRVGDFVVPEENTVYESTDEICSIWDFILITMN